MDSVDSDQREPHKDTTAREVNKKDLDALGVLSWEGLTGVDDPRLDDIKKERGYTYSDLIEVCPDKLPEYETKIKHFYREHIHYDEEIRYIVEGHGYFDVRDVNDKWIRISCEGGDMIILPEGMYHRFTTDSDNYVKANRLFVGEPIWTPYNRDDIVEKENASRLKYIENFLSKIPKDDEDTKQEEKRQKTDDN
jgi:1,2-dihydroxy-3-keto-5-methylthiopentene dioxygenase